MSAVRSLVVLVAEPSPLVADVVCGALLEAGHQPVRFAEAPSQLSATAARLSPDVLLVGPSFGRAGLVSVVPELLTLGIRTVLISPQALDRVEAQIMMAGASGYLSAATSDYAEIATEVGRAVSGSSPLHPDVVRAMLRHWREARTAASSADEMVELTPREIDVVRALQDGLTTRLIAGRLGVSEKTVEAHKSRLFAKLGAKNSSQALKLVSERRLV